MNEAASTDSSAADARGRPAPHVRRRGGARARCARCACAASTAERARRTADPRMARDERARRLRVGNDRRRAFAPLSRRLDRGIAAALRAAADADRRHEELYVDGARAGHLDGAHSRGHGARAPHGIQARGRPAGLALRLRRRRRRETDADAARPKHRARALRAQCAAPTARVSTSRSPRITAPTTRPSARRSPSAAATAHRLPATSSRSPRCRRSSSWSTAHAPSTREPQAIWPERRYSVEESRGYMDTAGAWTPGVFALELRATRSWRFRRVDGAVGRRHGARRPAALAAERDRRRACIAAADPAARHGLAAELVLAADQFIVTPVGRSADAARVRAAGDEERSVIAGYHWFTDWGRDTMISLEGLTLLDGPHRGSEGHPAHVRELHSRRPRCRTCFPRAIAKACTTRPTRRCGCSTRSIVISRRRATAHCCTRFCRSSSMSSSTTSPARDSASASIRTTACCGKGLRAFNSPGWTRRSATGSSRRGAARPSRSTRSGTTRCACSPTGHAHARAAAARRTARRGRGAQCATSFNRRFWHEPARHLYRHRRRRERRRRGLPAESGHRDLAGAPRARAALLATSPRGRPRRAADAVRPADVEPETPRLQAEVLRRPTSRDAAYHQGTVWPWLLGPFIDAWRRAFPRDTGAAARFLAAFDGHLDDGCVGSISEIFDAEPPYAPRGCVAQAWSVAEVLRCAVYAARDATGCNRARARALRRRAAAS